MIIGNFTCNEAQDTYTDELATLRLRPARWCSSRSELCGVRPDGTTSFSMIQLASDSGNAAALVFFLFDLLYLNGEDLCARLLVERKERFAALLSDTRSPLHYCDHQIGHGREFHQKARRGVDQAQRGGPELPFGQTRRFGSVPSVGRGYLWLLDPRRCPREPRPFRHG
jgi:hypothetical protein